MVFNIGGGLTGGCRTLIRREVWVRGSPSSSQQRVCTGSAFPRRLDSFLYLLLL